MSSHEANPAVHSRTVQVDPSGTPLNLSGLAIAGTPLTSKTVTISDGDWDNEAIEAGVLARIATDDDLYVAVDASASAPESSDFYLTAADGFVTLPLLGATHIHVKRVNAEDTTYRLQIFGAYTS